MQLVFIAALAIVCIPVFIGKLGSEDYGVFAVVTLVGNLTVFANLGTNRSLVKFIAEQGRTRESNYDIAITLVIVTATIVPVTLLFMALRKLVLVRLFNVPPGLLDQAGMLYGCLLVSNLFLLAGQSFSAILSALQKIYINNLLQMVYNFIGIREVGFFDIALKVKAQFQGLITRLLDPFYAFIAQLSDPKQLQRIVNDVEQKFLLLSVPLIAILAFTLRPLLHLWLGAGSNEQITLSSIFITCTFLVTMSVLPMYYFLLAKDHVGRATVLNLVTVGVNALLFFIFYRQYGFYASVIGLCGSALAAFFLTLWYQKKYLDCTIFSSPAPVLKLISSFGILAMTNYLVARFTPSAFPQILLVTGNTLVLSVITYRYLNMVAQRDIERWFGSGNGGSRFLIRMFVKKVTG